MTLGAKADSTILKLFLGCAVFIVLLSQMKT